MILAILVIANMVVAVVDLGSTDVMRGELTGASMLFIYFDLNDKEAYICLYNIRL